MSGDEESDSSHRSFGDPTYMILKRPEGRATGLYADDVSAFSPTDTGGETLLG